MSAIPFVPARSNLRLLDMVIFDPSLKGELASHKVVFASRLPAMVEDEAKRNQLQKLVRDCEREDYDSFAAAGGQALSVGMEAFGDGPATVAVGAAFGLKGSSATAILLESAKQENVLSTPHLRDILTVPEAFGSIPAVEDRLFSDDFVFGTKKVLVGVVTMSITGNVHIGSATESGVEGSVQVTLPSLIKATGGANGQSQVSTDTGGAGTFGACFMVYMLESISQDRSLLHVRGSRSIQRVDGRDLKLLFDWAKVGPARSVFAARTIGGPRSYYTGIGLADSRSFEEAVQQAAEQGEGTSLAHGAVIQGDNGLEVLAIVNVRAEAPDEMGNNVHWPGSLNFLYRAPTNELAKMFSDLKNNETVKVMGYTVNSIVPAVAFDNSRSLPFHYTPLKGDEDQEAKLPGAILRMEEGCTVLHIIDPLGNGTKVGGEAITHMTEGWFIDEDIRYVGVEDHEEQEHLRETGYHRLVDHEDFINHVKHLKLEPDSYVVMCRQEIKRSDMPLSGAAEVFRHDTGVAKQVYVLDSGGKKDTGTASTMSMSTKWTESSE